MNGVRDLRIERWVERVWGNVSGEPFEGLLLDGDAIWLWDAGVSDGRGLVVSSVKIYGGRCGNYIVIKRDSGVALFCKSSRRTRLTVNQHLIILNKRGILLIALSLAAGCAL
jgi:hypothetical protein